MKRKRKLNYQKWEGKWTSKRLAGTQYIHRDIEHSVITETLQRTFGKKYCESDVELLLSL